MIKISLQIISILYIVCFYGVHMFFYSQDHWPVLTLGLSALPPLEPWVTCAAHTYHHHPTRLIGLGGKITRLDAGLRLLHRKTVWSLATCAQVSDRCFIYNDSIFSQFLCHDRLILLSFLAGFEGRIGRMQFSFFAYFLNRKSFSWVICHFRHCFFSAANTKNPSTPTRLKCADQLKQTKKKDGCTAATEIAKCFTSNEHGVGTCCATCIFESVKAVK